MTKNDNPFDYQAYIKEMGYDKLPRPTKKETIKELVTEGERLLAAEKKPEPAPEPKKKKAKDEKARLDTAMAKKSDNIYVKARAEILEMMDAEQRAKIEEMEASGKTDNRIYQEFIDRIMRLAEKR